MTVHGVPRPHHLPPAQLLATRSLALALPQAILDQAPESPWGHEPRRFAVDEALDRDTTSARWARDVLPMVGGTVVDVGCGGGRSSLTLVPPASELIGVDRSGAMLDEFVQAAAMARVARRTVHGSWPEVAGSTPVGDVVVCHHVLYDVPDVIPFVVALTEHAQLAVVVEIPTRHPMSALAPAFRHFWDLERPAGPTHHDLVAVLDELGLQPEFTTSPRPALATFAADPDMLVPTVRRRLCLSADRDQELAAWLDANPLPWPDTVATIRWPGAAA